MALSSSVGNRLEIGISPREIVPLRILLVEDDVFFMRIVSALLSRNEGPVDAVFSAAKGLDLIRHQAYDILITDLMMEGFNGADLIRVSLDEQLIDRKHILVMTAEQKSSPEYQWIREQGIHVLPKPFTMPEFVAALTTVS